MLHVRYFCSYGKLTGYGRAARDYLAALSRVDGIELEIACLGDDHEVRSPEPRYQHLDRFAVPWNRVVGAPDVEVWHAPPRVLEAVDDFPLSDGLPLISGSRPPRVAITTWETSELPAIVRKTLAKFDETIMPSTFCDGLRGGNNAGGPGYVVPHCFDPDFWIDAPATGAAARAARDGAFRFYSIGAWGERKNTLGLLRAYLSAFTKRDRVQLVLVLDKTADMLAIRETIACSGLAYADLPALHIPDPSTPLSEVELFDMHASGDCFVSATRAEGFGLGLFEAAVMGRGIITPMFGGQNDFLRHCSRALDVPYRLTPCFGSARRGSDDGELLNISIPRGVDCKQSWADPDLAGMAYLMRCAVTFPDLRAARTAQDRRDREVLEQQFGYDAVGQLLANTLREICS